MEEYITRVRRQINEIVYNEAAETEEDVRNSAASYFSNNFISELLYRGASMCVSYADSRSIPNHLAAKTLSSYSKEDSIRIIGSTIGDSSVTGNVGLFNRLTYSDVVLKSPAKIGDMYDPSYYYDDDVFITYGKSNPSMVVVSAPKFEDAYFTALPDVMKTIAEDYAISEALLILGKAEQYDKVAKRMMDALARHALNRFATQ